MKLSEEFEGIAKLDGDDGYCFGVHLTLSDNDDFNSDVIDFLDNLCEEHEGKNMKIKIEAIIEE